MAKNGKITLAEMGKDIYYIKEDIREIKDILTKGANKISDNRAAIERNTTAIAYTWKVGGVVAALISLTIAVLGFIR